MMRKLNFCKLPTSLKKINNINNNNIYIKRDDMTGLAMGGNKARKLEYFMKDALNNDADYIVTYGSVHSNHCRMTAAAASKIGLPSLLILSKPENKPPYNGNYFLYDLLDADIHYVENNNVSVTIDKQLEKLKAKGNNPYFIYGGGHGNLGTQAYIDAYHEIEKQKKDMNINFDYIFLASGTGTTQAGLIIGKKSLNNNEKIIGISIAREKERGTNVIQESIEQYIKDNELEININRNEIIFLDKYIGKGYADINQNIKKTIKEIAKKEAILLDPVYTGKAFYGMKDYIKYNNIENKNILFIHTGGTPILFSNAEKFREDN